MDERAQTAIEVGLIIVAGIVIATVVALQMKSTANAAIDTSKTVKP